jgi:NADPH:quinone reductase-like Zn-dependent oxidoreductase
MPSEQNEALWMPGRRARFAVRPAPSTAPGPHEVVVRARAVAINPVDAMAGPAYRFVVPWLRYPAVIGTDVAGEVVEIGSAVTGLAPGDRVLGHAVGLERSHNRAAEGAYQDLVVLQDRMTSPIPDELPFERAAVVPLTLSTASVGLFQQDHLGLALPVADPAPRNEVVLVWGAGTGVGSSAVQLARNAGYTVVATASDRTAVGVRALGADAVLDRTDPAVVRRVVDEIGDRSLAGTIAIGSGSLAPTVAIAAAATGSGRIASAHPDPLTRFRARSARRRGVTVSFIWGGSLEGNEVGPAIYRAFLPGALATGAFRAAPEPTVVGSGLAAIPDAFRRFRAGGIGASKLVVTL